MNLRKNNYVRDIWNYNSILTSQKSLIKVWLWFLRKDFQIKYYYFMLHHILSPYTLFEMEFNTYLLFSTIPSYWPISVVKNNVTHQNCIPLSRCVWMDGCIWISTFLFGDWIFLVRPVLATKNYQMFLVAQFSCLWIRQSKKFVINFWVLMLMTEVFCLLKNKLGATWNCFILQLTIAIDVATNFFCYPKDFGWQIGWSTNFGH